MAKRPFYIPGTGPIWSPAVGRPVYVQDGQECVCCDAGGVIMAYRVCGCCETPEECEGRLPRYVRVANFPSGPGVYRHESGACFTVFGPAEPILGVSEDLYTDLRPAAGPFASCAACEGGCTCAEPTELVLSLGGWTTRPQVLEGASLGQRFWGEVVVSPSPMSGDYIVPANLTEFDPNILLATFPDAAIAEGHFGEWGRNDLELWLVKTEVERCVSVEGPPLCRHRWRLKAELEVRVANIRTTNNRAMVGPAWPLTLDYPGYAPYAVRWGPEVIVECNRGGRWRVCPDPYDPGYGYGFTACPPEYDPESGPDGGCGGWTHWPGCPAAPRLYKFNQGGYVDLGVAA